MLSYTFRNNKIRVYSHNNTILIPNMNATNNNIVVYILDHIDNFSNHLAVSRMIGCEARVTQGLTNFIDNNQKTYFWSDDAKKSYFENTGAAFKI